MMRQAKFQFYLGSSQMGFYGGYRIGKKGKGNVTITKRGVRYHPPSVGCLWVFVVVAVSMFGGVGAVLAAVL